MKNNSGELAIVTGASTGIGYELAKCCAEAGFNLLIAADEPEIKQAAAELKRFGVEVESVETDLATIEGVDRLYSAVDGRLVAALLANAGIGLGGAFLDQDFGQVRHVVDTNITGTIYLTQRIGREMRRQSYGRILFTGSIAGFMPGSFSAAYNGTKAFIDSFSFALRNELKDSGVTVTCLMPGATETEFFRRANMLDTEVGQSKKDDPADVARVGFEAMMKGEGDVVSGWKNKLMSAAALVTPSEVLAEQYRKKAQPGSGDKSDRGLEMKQEPITQVDGESNKSGLYAKAAKHPLVTGGMILAGAGLAYAAVRTIQSAGEKTARETHIELSIAIDRTPEELYAFWRDFKNLPLFMSNLKSVDDLGENRSHWIAGTPEGGLVEWDAEIFNDKENEMIAWRSLENADVIHAGSVRFQAAAEGHGTYVKVTMNYNPPGGKLGATIAKLIGANPARLIKDDLRRLKQLMETGEIATIAGQTSGRSEQAEPIASRPFAARAAGANS